MICCFDTYNNKYVIYYHTIIWTRVHVRCACVCVCVCVYFFVLIQGHDEIIVFLRPNDICKVARKYYTTPNENGFSPFFVLFVRHLFIILYTWISNEREYFNLHFVSFCHAPGSRSKRPTSTPVAFTRQVVRRQYSFFEVIISYVYIFHSI